MLASTRGLIVIDLALLTFVACAPAFAQDTSPVQAISPQARKRRTSYGGEIAFGSGHADRGFIVSDRPVVQPVLWLSGSGAELSVWGNFTLGETTDGSRPQIVEVELTREHKWRHVTIGPAIRMFVYHDPLGRSSTRSVAGWLYLSYDAGPLRLFTNHSVDVLTYRGAYFGEAGIESERRVLPSIAVGGSFAAGWASSRFNEAYAGVPTPHVPLAVEHMNLFAKLEYVNPVGSIKDRPAYWILKRAAERGEICDETTVIESSSGNFACALAAFTRLVGLRFIPVIDPNIS